MRNASSIDQFSLQPASAMASVDIAVVRDQYKELQARCDTLEDEVVRLRHQVAWFQRQIFGQKSGRRMIENNSLQGTLGYALDNLPQHPLPSKKHRVQSHDRQSKQGKLDDEGDHCSLFFDESKVPIETIILSNPDTADLTPEEYEVIGEKVSYRLAQRPGSYVVLKYIRPVIKKRDTQLISCPPAPVSVIDGSRADVSFIAGLLVDKFAYHLPLYRQHQRLLDAGFKVSRPWLTQLCSYGCSLLEAIYLAQFNSVRASRVKAMDETPIKAGQAGPGQLQKAYFWPVYGERDEICFPFFTNRNYDCVEEALGLSSIEGGVLLSDGYGAYDHYADKTGVIRAQCWSHARRKFFKAQEVESEGANQALDRISAIYQVESHIREQQLTGNAKHDYRQRYARPLVEQFFTWIEERFAAHGLLPSNPFVKALGYARKRQDALKAYLNDPDVPIDTNHLERALRPIPMGRKNWLFAWTELGAKHIGIIQSLITTCRLHNIDPYTYLVDVLQRISSHPQKLVEQLTPRLWKQHFGNHPMRSDISKV